MESSAVAAAVKSAIDVLKDRFAGRVTTKSEDSEHYAAEQKRQWVQSSARSPAAFVFPNDTREVADIVRIIKEKGIKFAVRTTGHNPNPGFASTDETGIVIDLRNLTSLKLADGVVQAGAGNTWGQVAEFLEAKDTAVVGGRFTGVGLGGFLLGGGMPAFVNLAGYGADNVVNFEVVLANSTVVNANAQENPDLWRSLKGGGTNFGIVTRFDLETHPEILKVNFAINLYDVSDYVNIHEATVKVQEAMETDPKLGFFANFQPSFVAVGLFYAGHLPEGEIPKGFKPFYNLKSLLQPEMPPRVNSTIGELVKAIGHLNPPNRLVSATMSSKVSAELYGDIHKKWVEIREAHPAASAIHYTIQALATSAIRYGCDHGGNAMGLENVPQSVWVFVGEWQHEADDQEITEALRSFNSAAMDMAKERGLYMRYEFMNDAGYFQNVLESYGPDSLKLLRDTGAKFDPEGLFQKQQFGGHFLHRR